MFEKNSLSIGILVGLLLPLLGYAVFSGLFELLDLALQTSSEGFRPQFRQRTSAILGIALNALALNYYSKRRMDQSVRGIVILTTVWIGVWLWMFGKLVV